MTSINWSRNQTAAALANFTARDSREAEDLASIREVAITARPIDRSSRFHLTASALVIEPISCRVLLRWHLRHSAWMQVGGHGDQGESDPCAVALREAEEETGLQDLSAFPEPDAPQILQVSVVAVAGNISEPAHLHGDVRYVMSTSSPESSVAESDKTPRRWCSLAEAEELVSEDNLRTVLRRTQALLEQYGSTPA
jgi:8-oxo-dGTP pyrophosphatase MutT (NUDIX family)